MGSLQSCSSWHTGHHAVSPKYKRSKQSQSVVFTVEPCDRISKPYYTLASELSGSSMTIGEVDMEESKGISQQDTSRVKPLALNRNSIVTIAVIAMVLWSSALTNLPSTSMRV